MKYETALLFGAGKTMPPSEKWFIIDTPETCRVYYVHSGRAYFLSGKKTFPLSEGSLYFFPPQLPFHVAQDKISPMLHTYFDFVMCPYTVSAEPVAVNCAEHPELTALVRAADILMETHPEYKATSHVYTPLIGCLDTILNLLPLPKSSTVDDKNILAALDMMNRVCETNLTVAEIAAKLGYNIDYFIRKFRTTTGITPYAYIKSIKLGSAAKMRDEGMKLSDIAARTGYSDAAALSKAIRKSDTRYSNRKNVRRGYAEVDPQD